MWLFYIAVGVGLGWLIPCPGPVSRFYARVGEWIRLKMGG
jgi:hypothetical protein